MRYVISVPNVKIAGDPEMHVEAGSSVALRCIVTNAMLRPKFVFWYRDKLGLSNSKTSYAKESITITDNIDKKPEGGDIVISDLSRPSEFSNSNNPMARSSNSNSRPTNDANRVTYWNRNKLDYNEMDEKDTHFTNPVSFKQTVTSILTIHEASSKHSGRYQCAPDNTRPAAINLHVIQGAYEEIRWNSSFLDIIKYQNYNPNISLIALQTKTQQACKEKRQIRAELH